MTTSILLHVGVCFRQLRYSTTVRRICQALIFKKALNKCLNRPLLSEGIEPQMTEKSLMHRKLPRIRLCVDIFADAKSIYRLRLCDISANADSICYKSLSPRRAYRVRSTYRMLRRISKILLGLISIIMLWDDTGRRPASGAGPPSGCTSGWRRYRCGPSAPEGRPDRHRSPACGRRSCGAGCGE